MRRRAVRPLLLALLTTAASLIPGVARAAGPGFVSLLFGRTVWVSATSSDGGATCTPVPGTVTLGQAHDDLLARGLRATGIVITSRTPETGLSCFKSYALQTGWDRIMTWRSQGWSFVSGGTHADVTTLNYEGTIAESCASLDVFEQHGIDATGMFAYGNNSWTQAAQVDPVSRCFDFGRQYNSATVNTLANTVAPWFQRTQSVNGGLCNDSTLSCYRSAGNATTRYTSPDLLAARVSAAPDTWYAVQFYRFVTGNRSSGNWSWDCRSSNWRQHWTSQGELYCYNDFLQVADAIQRAVTNGVVAADPSTVAAAWGRDLDVPPSGAPRSTETSATCVQSMAGAVASCTASVSDDADGIPVAPDGSDSVVWSADQPGAFSATTCTPAGARPTTTCSVTFTPSQSPSITVSASYLGSTDSLPSSASTTAVGMPRPTSTSTSCPAAGVEGIPFTCRATIVDTAPGSPITPGGAGSVSWSADAGGTFSSSTCSPTGSGGASSCAVTFTPATGSSGVTHIHASYAGDAFHANSVATDAAVTVTPTTPPDSTPPSVSFTNPLDGGTVPAGGTVTIRVNASDDDRVADVRFYVAGSLRCTDTTAPYTCTWWPRKQVGANIPLQAVARDPTGNQGSATINVTTA